MQLSLFESNNYHQGFEPFFRICGSKTKYSLAMAVEAVRPFITPQTRLIEPFCGAACVSLQIVPNYLLLADAQPMIILAFEVVRRKPRKFIAVFEEYRQNYIQNHSSENFYFIRDNPPKDPIQRAAWFVFVVKASFNWLWRVNSNGVCNTSYGEHRGFLRVNKGLPEYILEMTSWLDRPGVQISLSDFRMTLTDCNERDVIYVDPPYPGKFGGYTKEGFSKKDMKDLLTSLKKVWYNGAKIVFHCSVDLEIASQLFGWCRVLIHPVVRKMRLFELGLDQQIEMLCISQSRQQQLFPESGIEEKLLQMGAREICQVKSTWIDQRTNEEYLPKK